MEAKDVVKLLEVLSGETPLFDVFMRMMKTDPEGFLALYEGRPLPRPEPLSYDQFHEAALRNICKSFQDDQKIPAIKRVREYCDITGFTKYYGLKDAKDFVESTRWNWNPGRRI